MTQASDPFSDLDAAYVLGALAPAERLEFEQHLATCEACSRAVRDLAGLPGLLSRVDPAVLEDPPAAEPLPDALLTNLVRQVRGERRRRLLVTAGLAAAAVLAVATLLVTGVLGGDDEPPPAAAPRALAMTPVGGAPVHATLALQSVAWGTKLDLACKYSPDSSWGGTHAPTYTLLVRTRDGHTEKVGTWRSIEGRTMRLAAATAARRANIADVEVLAPDGHTVLRLEG